MWEWVNISDIGFISDFHPSFRNSVDAKSSFILFFLFTTFDFILFHISVGMLVSMGVPAIESYELFDSEKMDTRGQSK